MYIGMEDEKRRAVKEAVAIAIRETELKQNLKICKNLLLEGITPEKIASSLEIPIEKVKEISREINLK